MLLLLYIQPVGITIRRFSYFSIYLPFSCSEAQEKVIKPTSYGPISTTDLENEFFPFLTGQVLLPSVKHEKEASQKESRIYGIRPMGKRVLFYWIAKN